MAACTAFVQPRAPFEGSRCSGPVKKPDVAPETPSTAQGWAAARVTAPALSAIGSVVFARRNAARCGSKQTRAQVALQVVGVSAPMGKWDPLNLGSTDSKMDRYTAVEIKHGRISMLACVGYVVPELFHFPGCEDFKNGLGAFSTLPDFGWFQLFLFIGAHEVLVKPRADSFGPWDFGLGTFLLDGISDEELERKQTAERNNGRLAMVAILGLMVQDGMFGMTPFVMQNNGGWLADRFFKYIPQCVSGLTPDKYWC